MECVSKRVPILLSRGMARLVVVDSVAAPFRCEYDVQALATRAKHLRLLGATLRRLSSTFRSPVLCINQVAEASGLCPLPWENRTDWMGGEAAEVATAADPHSLGFFQVTEMVEEQESMPRPLG